MVKVEFEAVKVPVFPPAFVSSTVKLVGEVAPGKNLYALPVVGVTPPKSTVSEVVVKEAVAVIPPTVLLT